MKWLQTTGLTIMINNILGAFLYPRKFFHCQRRLWVMCSGDCLWAAMCLQRFCCKNYLRLRDGRYQNFYVDGISICKASIYQYITIFITVWTFCLNLCKCIKHTAFCFKFLCFGDLNLPLLLKTPALWTLLLPWLTSNPKKSLLAIYVF